MCGRWSGEGRWFDVQEVAGGGQVHGRWSGALQVVRCRWSDARGGRCTGGGQVRSRWFDVQQVVRCVAGGQVQVV